MSRRKSWSDDELREAVTASRTFKEVHARPGLQPSGGSHSAVLPLEQVLARDSPHTSSSDLRRRLLSEGVKEHRCGSAADRSGGVGRSRCSWIT